MAEYIDREAVLRDWPLCDEPADAYQFIRGFPAADVVERKTGRWCADYDGYSDGEPVYDMWWCSACGEYFDEWDDRPTWKYCPNCGAKMEGDNIDETI